LKSSLLRNLEALARLITYMLCHRPDEFGLVLSAEGFVPLKQLLQVLAGEPGWGFARRHHLEEVTALIQPPSFEIQGDRIRGLAPGPAQLRRPAGEAPPALLYLAITPKSHHRVWEQGLQAPPDRELLLATNPEWARRLGRRRTPEPVLVTIQAQAAARAGVTFQGYGEDLFLTQAVPREFLQLPSPPQGPEKPKPEPARPLSKTLPGSLILDLPQMLQEGAKHQGKRPDEPVWKKGARALRKKRRRED
jgi:putative RNA 2'-phosphotransferase